MTRRVFLPAAIVLFAILATANSGGYRYGASDQAFYAPAVARQIDPALFPRDSGLLSTQTRLWLGDEMIGGLARATTADLPVLFAALYGATMIVLATGGVMLMRAMGASAWAAAAFLLLLTLRHQIAKTGVNTLEGYMHPRLLAFAFGLMAIAALLGRRRAATLLSLAAAAALHTTTALWFGVLVLVAVGGEQWQSANARRLPWALSAGAIGAAAVWAVVFGPLAGSLTVIDAQWLWVIEGRDYLFPSTWPFYAWIANLSYPIVVWLLFRHRRALGVAATGEAAAVAGLLALVVVFLVSVPLTAMRIGLAVQLQVNRVFWLLDAVAAAYLAWWVLDRLLPRVAPAARPIAIGMLIALSAARGTYVLSADVRRPLFELRPENDWTDAMAWLQTQPAHWHVLADPQHAWKYGISVRAAAFRDTVLELSKDPSIAMYDRAVAMRIAERMRTLSGFEQFGETEIRAIDARYDPDVLVLEQPTALPFPVLYRNARFVIYDLR